MELAFLNKELRELCEDEDIAIVQLGVVIAKELQSRLADLAAATSVNDLLTGRPKAIENQAWPSYKIDLANGFRLVFCANHVKAPVNQNGTIDWSRVNHIKILQIEETNE